MWKKIHNLLVRSAAGVQEFGGVEIYDIDESTRWASSIATLYIVLFFLSLVYFAYTGTMAGFTQNFLSLDAGDSSQVCTEVPQTVTAAYEASYTGYWQTNSSFNFNQSLFKLDFMGSHISNEKFSKSMLVFKDKLQLMGAKAKLRSLAWTAIAMAAFEFRDEDANMRLYSNVDAGIVFNQLTIMATLSSAKGICDGHDPSRNLDGYTSGFFESSSASLVMSIPVAQNLSRVDFTLNNGGSWGDIANKKLKIPPTCKNFRDFINYGDPFNAIYRSGSIDIKFDSRSMVTAIALNLGIIDLNGLIHLQAEDMAFLGPFVAYSDPYYSSPPMTPILCYDKTKAVDDVAKITFTKEQLVGPPICFVQYVLGTQSTKLLFYPVIGQLKPMFNKNVRNMASARKVACDCPVDTENPFCNMQDFYLGLFFDNTPDADDTSDGDGNLAVKQLGINMQAKLLADPISGDIAIMDAFSDVLAYSGNVFYNSALADKELRVMDLIASDDEAVVAKKKADAEAKGPTAAKTPQEEAEEAMKILLGLNKNSVKPTPCEACVTKINPLFPVSLCSAVTPSPTPGFFGGAPRSNSPTSPSTYSPTMRPTPTREPSSVSGIPTRFDSRYTPSPNIGDDNVSSAEDTNALAAKAEAVAPVTRRLGTGQCSDCERQPTQVPLFALFASSPRFTLP